MAGGAAALCTCHSDLDFLCGLCGIISHFSNVDRHHLSAHSKEARQVNNKGLLLRICDPTAEFGNTSSSATNLHYLFSAAFAASDADRPAAARVLSG